MDGKTTHEGMRKTTAVLSSNTEILIVSREEQETQNYKNYKSLTLHKKNKRGIYKK